MVVLEKGGVLISEEPLCALTESTIMSKLSLLARSRVCWMHGEHGRPPRNQVPLPPALGDRLNCGMELELFHRVSTSNTKRWQNLSSGINMN